MLTADLTTRERQTWAQKLAQWQNEVDDYGVDGRSYVPPGTVELFLHEGLVEDAMRAVEQGASYIMLERVVDAAIPSHADWAARYVVNRPSPP